MHQNKPLSQTSMPSVKLLYFRKQQKFALINLKFNQRGMTIRHRVNCQKDANGMANSEGSDQTAPLEAVLTAPLGAVLSGSALRPDLPVRKLRIIMGSYRDLLEAVFPNGRRTVGHFR